MEEWKAAHRKRGGWSQNQGIETELIQTDKCSVAPISPPQALSACDEDGLTAIVGW